MRKITCSLMTFAALTAANYVLADTAYFTGAGANSGRVSTTNWTLVENWSTGVVPTIDTDVIADKTHLTGTQTGFFLGTNQTASAKTLTLAIDSTASEFRMYQGTKLTISDALTVKRTGTFRIAGDSKGTNLPLITLGSVEVGRTDSSAGILLAFGQTRTETSDGWGPSKSKY